MHIILLILKIIGLILLGILGLLVLILLLLLLSPLGYSGTGCYHSDGKKKLLGNFHYLFHALKLDLMWDGEKVKFRIKLLGFNLKKGSTSLGSDASEHEEDAADDDFFHETILDDNSSASTLFDEMEAAQNLTASEDTSASDAGDVTSEVYESENTDASPSQYSETDAEGNAAESESISQTESQTQRDEEKKKPFDKLKELAEKGKTVYELITKPSMVKLRNKLIRRVVRLVKHILPGDLQMKGEFGLEDPAAMGKIMEVYAWLYAFLGEHFDISTDFERQHIDVKGRLKGRIVPIYILHQILCMAIALLLQKDARKFIFGKLFHKNG